MTNLTPDEITEIYQSINFWDHDDSGFPAVVNRIIAARVAAVRETIAADIEAMQADATAYRLGFGVAQTQAERIARGNQDQP